MTIKIIINGAEGKMGKVTQTAICKEPDFKLVACAGRKDNLADLIKKSHADVVIDFTLPECVFENAKTIINNNARFVIGTSGLTLEEIEQLRQQCQTKKIGGIIAPNFSIGAILMMKYAKDAAKYLPNVEIIEMHHEQKVDAPSGTSAKTAEMIAENRNEATHSNPHPDRARGETYQGITIHSVRLPGLFAHQSVIFGAPGETLTIRHDGMDRNAMMPGVVLACRKVMDIDHLIYGLENLL